jgi:hypothetical protein
LIEVNVARPGIDHTLFMRRLPLSAFLPFLSVLWLATMAGVADTAPAIATTDAKEMVLKAKRDPATGQLIIADSGQPVLCYQYQPTAPGELLGKIHPDNRKYARARSNYIHPLIGPGGEELTLDWALDHPHHRGIYWAWPEVDFRGERGDWHALQRISARPTGRYSVEASPLWAQIEAENDWVWDEQEPIVRELAVIRVYQLGSHGRCVDLEFHFTALQEDVWLARRGTDAYGGLNIRLSSVRDQRISTHTDPPEANPRMAWACLSGVFASAKQPASFAILQHRDNPEYPGAWIQYPELNWLQPTFPSAGARYKLEKDRSLVLRFRLWIMAGEKPAKELLAEQWRAFHAATK